jgi:glycosyltransferase involved in cell wall biosynthesis
MPRILLIAYHFHPDLEVGAVRSVKFARYLPEFGWEPYVLTIDTRFIPKTDEGKLDLDCGIFRTTKWPTIDDGYRWLKKRIKRQETSNSIGASDQSSSGSMSDESDMPVPPFWKRFISSLSQTPDDAIGWLIPASWKAIRLIRKYNIDVIYTSGPPYTCHLVGLIAAMMTRRKLVVDFRDPWTSGNRIGSHFNAVSLAVERFLERRVISKADLVITSTPAITAQLTEMHSPGENRIATILNGYDEDDFRGRTRHPVQDGKPMTFLYAGTLYMGRDPSPLFRAMAELLEAGDLGKNDIRLEIIGNIEYDDRQLTNSITNLGIGDIVKIGGPVARDRYFDRIINADVLILMQSESAGPQIPGKTYEYLATGNKILGLLHDGATRDLLEKYDNVLISDPGDNDRIKECIMTLKKGFSQNPQKSNNAANLKDITRRRQTERLANLLNNLK